MLVIPYTVGMVAIIFKVSPKFSLEMLHRSASGYLWHRGKGVPVSGRDQEYDEYKDRL